MILQNNKGNAIIQFLAAVIFLLICVFAAIQIAGMLYTMNALGSELTRASYEADATEAILATDKNLFIKDAIARESNGLDAAKIRVENTQIKTSVLTSSGTPANNSAGLSSIHATSDKITVSFDVYYVVPSVIEMTGLSNQTLFRHIEFDIINKTTIEMS